MSQMLRLFFVNIIFISLITPCFADEIGRLQAIELKKTSKAWDGSELPNYPQGKPEITILNIKIPPNYKLPMHKHPVINVGILTKGQLKVVSENGESLLLKEGESIIEIVDKWHYGINEGPDVAEIFVVYMGIVGSSITVYK